jgi:hypothetical protein
MNTKDIQNKFSENIYHNFDMINDELNNIYINVCKSVKNNYSGLLYSNGRKRNLIERLDIEELFLMNVPAKIILAILDISIYESILNDEYSLLCNGIFTYSRLRSLNRLHLPGMNLCCSVESFILDDKVLFNNSFKGKIEIDQNDYNMENYLFDNFIKIIFFNQTNWKEIVLKQYEDNINKTIKGKFDMKLLEILKNIATGENNFENDYNSLVKLHPKCQWLTQGWYRECKLINHMPIFLAGIYKLIGKQLRIETDKEYFAKFIEYLNNENNIENKLVYNFTGRIDFLNRILDKEYENFSKEYKNKCHCT